MLMWPTGKSKKILITLAVLLLIFGLWILYQDWQEEQIFEKLQTRGEGSLTANDWLKLPEILEEKYRADNYGSTTPEGTLELFIVALKSGDAELAAKYFIPEKQIEYKKAFLNWIKLNKNKEIAETLINASGGEEIMKGRYIMSVLNSENIAYMSISFLKNNFSEKWKIQSL